MKAVIEKILSCLPVLIIAGIAHAYTPKEGSVTGTFGPFLNKTNFTGSSSGAKASVLGGPGLVAVGDISDHSGLEVAMFYMPKMFFRDADGLFIAEKVQMLQVNMGYRRWLNPYFSTSLTFYSTYAIGDEEIVHSDFNPRNSVGTSARDRTEYGFDWALQGDLYSWDKSAIVLDLRYSMNVTPKKDEKADHYGVMLGYRYLLKEKKGKEPEKPAN